MSVQCAVCIAMLRAQKMLVFTKCLHRLTLFGCVCQPIFVWSVVCRHLCSSLKRSNDQVQQLLCEGKIPRSSRYTEVQHRTSKMHLWSSNLQAMSTTVMVLGCGRRWSPSLEAQLETSQDGSCVGGDHIASQLCELGATTLPRSGRNGGMLRVW